MSRYERMFELPKREALFEQAAAIIRKAIERGTWNGFLPGERHLCEMLQVSRPTIRTALHMLAKQGWLDIRQGLSCRILHGQQTSTALQNRLIGLITHEPMTRMSLTAYQNISEMRAHLTEHGFVTEIFVCRSGSTRLQIRRIEAFVRQRHVFCCVLLSVSKELQQWFAGQTVPALVLGSCHAGVHLPCLDVDYRSVCRHAAGMFLSKGHRRMALIVPNSGLAGDLASEQGFKEAVAKGNYDDDHRAIIVRHNGTAQNIAAKLEVLIDSVGAPTALLVAKPWHVFAVIICLLRHGISMPGTVSLIARDQDILFESVIPPISHYQFPGGAFAQRLSRLMLKLADRGYLSPEPHLMFPRFFQGGTVTRPPD